VGTSLAIFFCNAIAAAPAVFWVSDPVRPGETVQVCGENLASNALVQLGRLDDGLPTQVGNWPPTLPGSARNITIWQAGDQSLKFPVPVDLQPGVFVFQITVGNSSTIGLLNRPDVWWAQGDLGTNGSPGGWIRAFGRNLGWTNPVSAFRTVIRLEGPAVVTLSATGDCYSAHVELPADLPPGSYSLRLHNGAGGTNAWSPAVPITIAQPLAWPQKVFDVTAFGARGDGVFNCDQTIATAVQRARASGGGIVFFPRGRYALSNTVVIPKGIVLRGERTEWVCLAWCDFANPPLALVQGSNSFALENLTLYANNHKHIVVSDFGGTPGAGNVFLRNVRIRGDAYRGRLTPEEVNRRLTNALTISTGGGDTVHVGGNNIVITGCDLYGSGRPLNLRGVRGGLISGNRLYNGRWGWYRLTDSDGVIFENNRVEGADLMSSGGTLDCSGSGASSQNICFSENRFNFFNGRDADAISTKGAAMAYWGSISSASGTSLTLNGQPNWTLRYNWSGGGVFILSGRGAGQYRRVVSCNGQIVQIDRPWDVPPNTVSTLLICAVQRHYLVVGNEFADTGGIQLQAGATECIVAGNTAVRMRGFTTAGIWDGSGYNPNWYCQFLDNRISEGNYYQWTNAVDSGITIINAGKPPYGGSLNYGTMLRRNRLENNASVQVTGACRDGLIEGNSISNTRLGISLDPAATNWLVNANSFTNVATTAGR